jgi:hypothetical protein
MLGGCFLPEVTLDEVVLPEQAGSGGSGESRSTGRLGGADAVGGGGGGGLGGSGESAGTGGLAGTPGSAGAGASSAGSGGTAGNGQGGAAVGSAAPAAPGMMALPSQLSPDFTTSRPDRETACFQYCGLYNDICAEHPANEYAGVIDCVNVCMESAWPIGDPSMHEPGTIICRYWHAALAYDQGQTPHCYHAARYPTMGGCQVLP